MVTDTNWKLEYVSGEFDAIWNYRGMLTNGRGPVRYTRIELDDRGRVINNFGPESWKYLLLEALLIIMMTYFYTSVVFNPVEQADNLRKYGGYIPGIRPGPPTAQYLDRVLTRLTLPGSLYLAAIAVLPSLFIRYGGFSQATSRALGGTSVLIVVGVALDTMRQMESQMMMRSYEGFLK